MAAQIITAEHSHFLTISQPPFTHSGDCFPNFDERTISINPKNPIPPNMNQGPSAMNKPDELFAIVPVSATSSAPANAILVGGPLSKIMENIPDTHARHDSIRAHQAARIDAMATEQAQKATRALQSQAFCDSVNQISARLDALEKRRAQRERQIAAQQKADEQKQIQDYLNTLPDPDDDPAIHGHFNTGDLSTPLPPTNSDNEGDLPENLLQTTPPTPGNYPSSDPSELGYSQQSKYRQMPAISLASEDGY